MEVSVKIEPDADGYTGRECPTCEKYFKIKFGTGLPGSPPCHCPYCNHTGPQTEFWTKQQIEYAQSVAMHQLSGQFLKELKKLERRPDPRAMISIGMTVKGSPTESVYPTPHRSWPGAPLPMASDKPRWTEPPPR